MRNISFIFLALLISLLIHGLFFSLPMYIDTKSNPLIYSWNSVIRQEDLFSKTKKVNFPPEVSFSLDKVRKDYFSLLSTTGLFTTEESDKKNLGVLANSRRLQDTPIFHRQNKQHFFLWEREVPFSTLEKEKGLYKAYVSPYGKVLIIYPQKLPFNSSGSLYLQEYIRKASFFVDDKFFWTKLEGIVK